MADALAPLDDPAYQPEHPPVDGRIPAVVEKWGAASQIRWFRRYQDQLKPLPATEWARYYVDSEQHRGTCCESCDEDIAMGFQDPDPSYCCCMALREDREEASRG